MGIKGLWGGGRPPLGYDFVDHRLVVNETEATVVREIYALFLESGNLTAVARECQAKNRTSKTYMPATGVLQVGVPLRAASIRKILMNPVYAGFVHAGNELHRGIHHSIVAEEMWERVAKIRASQISARIKLARREVLDGLMYDCFGRSMTMNRLCKRGKLYLHYRSNQNAWGARHAIKRLRMNSSEAEQLILTALQDLLSGREQLRSVLLESGRSAADLRAACRKGSIASRRLGALTREQLGSVFRTLIYRVEVSRERIKIITRTLEYDQLLEWNFVGYLRRRTEDGPHVLTHIIDIACAGIIRLERFVRLPITAQKSQTYRINKRLRELVSDIRHAWVMIEANRDLSPAEIAKRSNASLSHFMRLLRLNYLAPDIITSIMDGTQPRELTRKALMDANLPLDWGLQRKLFGFPEQPPMRTCESAY
jgi:hypothetical protein